MNGSWRPLWLSHAFDWARTKRSCWMFSNRISDFILFGNLFIGHASRCISWNSKRSSLLPVRSRTSWIMWTTHNSSLLIDGHHSYWQLRTLWMFKTLANDSANGVIRKSSLERICEIMKVFVDGGLWVRTACDLLPHSTVSIVLGAVRDSLQLFRVCFRNERFQLFGRWTEMVLQFADWIKSQSFLPSKLPLPRIPEIDRWPKLSTVLRIFSPTPISWRRM